MLPSVLLIKLKTEQCVYLVYMSVTVHQLLLLRLITRAGGTLNTHNTSRAVYAARSLSFIVGILVFNV